MTAFNYLRRKSARTLQLLQPCSNNVHKGLRIFIRNESSFIPQRVLIVAKMTQYLCEKMREPELNEAQLKKKLLERGSNYDRMLAAHQATKSVERQVTEVLKKLNVEYKVVDRRNLDESSFSWADLILPIGGDGTFLLASNLVTDNKKMVVGINSYPEKSEGFLMLPAKYTKNIPQIFEMLKAGDYNILMRRRIRITLKGGRIWSAPFHMHEKGRIAAGERFYHRQQSKVDAHNSPPKERRLPWFALNEVFVGESLSARTSDLLIKLNDDEVYQKVKCSGLCVSTGTGSTSWYKSINSLSCQTVEEILKLLDNNKQFTNEQIERICSSFNSSLHYNAEEPRLCYSIRDMIVTDVLPVLKDMQPRGLSEKMIVRSQCFDASLVLDGGIAVPFHFGTTAVLETYPEDSLRNIILPE